MTWHNAGYKDWLSLSTDHSQFKLKFNRKAVDTKSFLEEADNAAKLLYQEWNDKPLYLALSGGIDSELVANVLYKNQIPFTPVILKIENLNCLETWYAEYWCEQHQITPIVLEYSIDDYIKAFINHFPKLVELNNYLQAPILIIYDYVYSKGGYCLYAGGDINLDSERNEFFCNTLDFISNLINIGHHPTSFFMFTPELAASYIKEFDVNKNEQNNKLLFYNVLPRPKIEYIDSLHNHIKVIPTRDKLYHIYSLAKNNFDSFYWYGSKEKLLQDLCE